MPLRQLLTAAVVSTALAGCASAPPASSAPESASERAPLVFPGAKHWKGTMRPTQSYNAAAVGSQRQNAYGGAELTVSASNPTLTHVTVNVAVPVDLGLGMIGWGLAQGRCGSGNPTVLSPSSFPPIQLNATGQGTVDAQIPFIIPDNGTYHVNVFRGAGTQLVDVITCADLRRDS
ncbi:MAG: hypothetical protein JWL97_2573 [Gemmatimonadales bacterium]|jgi:hypothetical protein|nr:hypothetical protein [Gemmatimonadales bacterium]